MIREIKDEIKPMIGQVCDYQIEKSSSMLKMMIKKLKKLGGIRNSVLGYKHYLETGEKNADPERFDALYPEV